MRNHPPLNNLQNLHRSAGLTLLEVLVALAILAIALSAAIKVTGQSIQTFTWLQDKTLASFAGLNILNEFRAGLRKAESSEENGQTVYLGRRFSWQASITATKNPTIQEIHLQIGPSSEENDTLQPLAKLTGYLDAPEK